MRLNFFNKFSPFAQVKSPRRLPEGWLFLPVPSELVSPDLSQEASGPYVMARRVRVRNRVSKMSSRVRKHPQKQSETPLDTSDVALKALVGFRLNLKI